jgi:transcriptional regulator with PAS, ATPase and Fis domain
MLTRDPSLLPPAILPVTLRRGADRRRGIAALTTAITTGLALAEPRAARERLEEELRRALQARSVRLRDDSAQAVAPPPDAVCFDVPASPGDSHARLEVIFDKPRPLDDWTCQLIEAATQLSSMVLELERALGRGRFAALNRATDGAAPLIGSSDAIRRVRERIERVAATDFTVLIEGESGSGKELVARQVHELSRRRRGPFVAVNCAAIVETLLEAELFGIEERTATGVRGRRGKFEHAHEGTLFLDEVSDLSAAAQSKLLRAIQDLSIERVGGSNPRRINTRIVVATNRPLAGMVADGRFRMDLYYRLHGVEVQVPPLRFRKSDILELTQHFLARHHGRGRYTMTAAAVDALMAYDWPGNVRELERMIEGAVAIAESRQIRLDDLPASLRGDYGEILMPSAQDDHTMRAWGSRYARMMLERCGGNKREACRRLCISYHTLNAYLEYRPGQKLLARRARLPAPIANEQHMNS